MLHRQGRVTDANTGFYLPDGSVLSPDAAYLRPERLTGLTKAQGARFPRLCPNFVIELLSGSDRLPDAQETMVLWVANGAAVGWLVDPYQQKVHIYEPGAIASAVPGKSIHGTGPVEGFTPRHQ